MNLLQTISKTKPDKRTYKHNGKCWVRLTSEQWRAIRQASRLITMCSSESTKVHRHYMFTSQG